MSLKELKSFTFSQKLKLKVSHFLYSLNLEVEKAQFKRGKRRTKKRKTPFKPGNDKPARPNYTKYKIHSWSKFIPGISISTPWLIPVSHLPGIGYSLRTAIGHTLLHISYTFKSRFNKDGLLGLKDIKSPFVSFNRDDIWISDKDFALRAVQGPSPQVIRKSKTDDRVLSRISRELLEQLTGLADFESICSRLFIIDYSLFEGIKSKDGFAVGAPQALFFQSPDDVLLKPIAISISKEDPNIYTASDAKEAWTYAKLSFLQNEVLYMPLITHVVEAHLWMDPVIIATDFYLPQGHPIHALLRDNFKGNYAINKMAYFLLLKPKALFDQISQFRYPEIFEIVRRGFYNFSINKRIVPADFKQRDVNEITYYPYRDDVSLLWDALRQYVENYLHVFYPSEIEMDADPHLREWKASIKKELKIDESTSLADLITAILFNVYDHNIHQNSIVKHYLDPYHATALTGKIPQDKSEITEDFLFDSLGDIKSKMGRGYLIRVITDQTEVFSPATFDDPALNQVTNQLQKSLQTIEETIRMKNRQRIEPYTSAYPSKIDNSIKI